MWQISLVEFRLGAQEPRWQALFQVPVQQALFQMPVQQVLLLQVRVQQVLLLQVPVQQVLLLRVRVPAQVDLIYEPAYAHAWLVRLLVVSLGLPGLLQLQLCELLLDLLQSHPEQRPWLLGRVLGLSRLLLWS